MWKHPRPGPAADESAVGRPPGAQGGEDQASKQEAGQGHVDHLEARGQGEVGQSQAGAELTRGDEGGDQGETAQVRSGWEGTAGAPEQAPAAQKGEKARGAVQVVQVTHLPQKVPAGHFRRLRRGEVDTAAYHGAEKHLDQGECDDQAGHAGEAALPPRQRGWRGGGEKAGEGGVEQEGDDEQGDEEVDGDETGV